MAWRRWHDDVLQTEHLRLLPDVPPPVGAVGAGRLVEEGHPEQRRELARRRAPRVRLHGAPVVQRHRLAAVPPEVAVGTEEDAPRAGGAGAAEDGPRGAAVRAERRARVAGADAVRAVHVAVARQAQPGGVRAAVDRRRRGPAAVVAGHRLGVAAGVSRLGLGLVVTGHLLPRRLGTYC